VEALAWLCDRREETIITASHVVACYRMRYRGDSGTSFHYKFDCGDDPGAIPR